MAFTSGAVAVTLLLIILSSTCFAAALRAVKPLVTLSNDGFIVPKLTSLIAVVIFFTYCFAAPPCEDP